ncbi:MAG: 2-hydroxychromene-2-carboxylate isomerase [Minwuia sp.]|uniref:2-hydroxychromene-2-carboxylate isomerase n=1 Tax=Minwuia sp. TaxID=2493630 RepID=UPI003A866C5C
MTVDYYCALSSPWSYLGHERLGKIAAARKLAIRIHPVNALAIFDRTGGLPLPKRSPERQAYRLQELERWRKRLGVALNLKPAHFPADETEAARLVVASREAGRDAFGLAGRFMRAVWAEERNIADPGTIGAIVAEAGQDHAELVKTADSIDALALRDRDGEAAIARGVFGVPTYVVGDQLFWGQDRLEFVEEVLS